MAGKPAAAGINTGDQDPARFAGHIQKAKHNNFLFNNCPKGLCNL